jgi:hypothetical protein
MYSTRKKRLHSHSNVSGIRDQEQKPTRSKTGSRDHISSGRILTEIIAGIETYWGNLPTWKP